MHYVYVKFAFDQLLTKDTLLIEQRLFWLLSQLPLEGSSWSCIPRTFHACATYDV